MKDIAQLNWFQIGASGTENIGLPDLPTWGSHMVPQLEHIVGKSRTFGLLGLLAFLFVWLVSTRSKRNDLFNIPLLTDENNDFAKIMAEGYQNACHSLLKTRHDGQMLTVLL
jgi:hypothetical protein